LLIWRCSSISYTLFELAGPPRSVVASKRACCFDGMVGCTAFIHSHLTLTWNYCGHVRMDIILFDSALMLLFSHGWRMRWLWLCRRIHYSIVCSPIEHICVFCFVYYYFRLLKFWLKQRYCKDGFVAICLAYYWYLEYSWTNVWYWISWNVKVRGGRDATKLSFFWVRIQVLPLNTRPDMIRRAQNADVPTLKQRNCETLASSIR
jgi:hypothetical protein